MRTFLTAALMAALALAGCLDGDDASTDDSPIDSFNSVDVTPGQYDAHPAYDYPVNGELPVSTDGVTRVVNGDGSIQWYRPAQRPLPATLNTVEPLASVDSQAGTAGGIAVFGPLAIYGNRGSDGGMAVVDLSDPANPVAVGFSADTPVRDADIIAYPDGRLVAITTAGGNTQYATDITDPAEPYLLSTIETPTNNHNVFVVPGTPLTYNRGAAGNVDIVDWTDPQFPQLLAPFTGTGSGCHDITFYVDADKQRAYCAGYANSEIWDIADPTAPTMVHAEPYPGIEQGLPVAGDGTTPDSGTTFPLSFSHLAMVNHDASILIVGDETGGGGINGCDVYAETPLGSESGPLGNLWFYDLSDETNPVLLSHLSPEFYDDPADLQGSCTAHFGRLVEDTGYLVMGFYTSGVVLVDFRDPAAPIITDRLVQPGSSIWDVQYHQGYLVTGDIGRGMDILTLE